METFMEEAEGKLCQQLNTFCAAIDDQVDPLGLVQKKVDAIKLGSKMMKAAYDLSRNSQIYSHSMVSYKNLVFYGPGNKMLGDVPTLNTISYPMPILTNCNVRAQFADLIHDCKSSPNFTAGIGVGLGIVKPPSANAATDFSPNLNVKLAMGGHPLLHAKKAAYQGYELYKDCGDGNGFVHFKTVLYADYMDDSLLPAIGFSQVWRYKAIYILKGEEVGILSKIVTITVSGAE